MPLIEIDWPAPHSHCTSNEQPCRPSKAVAMTLLRAAKMLEHSKRRVRPQNLGRRRGLSSPN
jgi:hypothetical protein